MAQRPDPLSAVGSRSIFSGQRGTTLVELVVASSLVALVGVFIAYASSGTSRDLHQVKGAGLAISEAQAARFRLLGDSKAASSLTCTSDTTYNLTLGEMPQITLVEYRLSDRKLIRWDSATSNEIVVATRVGGLECHDDGQGEISVNLRFGDAEPAFRLHMTATEVGI